MPKVLHLRTVTGYGGGPEKTLLNSQRFIGGDYELRLAYVRPADDPDYDMPARAAAHGVPLIDIPEKSGLDPRTFWRLFKEIRSFQPHLLHPHDYKTNILSIPLGRLFGVPVVTTMHGYVTLGGRLDWYYRLDRWALRRMRHVIAVSEDLVTVLKDAGVLPERYSVIDNGIDCEHFQRTTDRALAKRRLGIPSERLVLGCVGRLFPEKGFDLLIEATARLLARGYDLELVIAGEGPEAADLEQLARRLGCGERVRLLGHQADTIALYEALDVFVLSSLREGLPNVLLEACSMSLPVVATDVGAVARVIENGQNGFLIKSINADEIAAAIVLVLDDPALRQRFGRQARQTVEAGFSFRRRMAKVRAIYDAVLNLPIPSNTPDSETRKRQTTR